MNVEEIVTRVQKIFGDEAGVQISSEDIIRWINDAQEQIVLDNTGLMEATGYTNSVAEQTDYSLPTDLSVLRAVHYKGFKLRSLSFNEFEQYIDGYKAPPSENVYGDGVPECFMVWNNTITLFPKPDESVTNGLTIYYVKHPTSVETLVDVPEIPVQYHNAIVKYCLAQAYELDADYDASERKNAQFEKDTMKLNDRNKWVSQDVYPSITTLPEDENFGYWGYSGGVC